MKACMDCGQPTGKAPQAKRCLTCRDAYIKALGQTAAYRERKKAYERARRQTLGYKVHRKEYMKVYEQTAAYKVRKNAYKRSSRQTPEYKAYQKEYMKAYYQTPTYKAYKKIYYQTPEFKRRNATKLEIRRVLFGGEKGCSITGLPVELREAAKAIVAVRVLVKELTHAQPE